MSQVRITLALAAALAAAPAIAGAQVTTFVQPPQKAVDTVTVVTAADSAARRDSLARAQVANMKAWVDSAAGDVVTTRTDGSMTSEAPAQEFRNGSRAPETASPLPMLALLGAGAMSAGWLLRRART